MNPDLAIKLMHGVVRAAVDERELAVSAVLGDVYHALTADGLLHFRASASPDSLVIDIIGDDAEPTRSTTLALRRMTTAVLTEDVTAFIQDAMIDALADDLGIELNDDRNGFSLGDWEEIA